MAAIKPKVVGPASSAVKLTPPPAGRPTVAPTPKTKTWAQPPRRIKLYNTHTLETLEVAYFHHGKYDPVALKKLNYFLRDHYANKVATIDPRLFDLLFAVQNSLQTREAFRVISGYRSPATNAALRAESDGVALHSYHMKGMAVDVALADRRVGAISKCARDMNCGGVGTYYGSGFVHLDVGPVRTWGA